MLGCDFGSIVVFFFFFFFKQKTAYEMRISDWSSDVCSSDLLLGPRLGLDDFADLDVETQIDGVTVGTGRAIDVLDGPWGSLAFLVDLHRRGVIELKPGQWISAGAITGVHTIGVGRTATTRFGSTVTIARTAIEETGLAD